MLFKNCIWLSGPVAGQNGGHFWRHHAETSFTARKIGGPNSHPAHRRHISPLSAKLAEEAGFDGIWASGFELSAHYGLADVSLITMTQHLDMVFAMAGRTALPIVADIDTGFGNAVNVDYAVKQYERAGASAVVIEDKHFPKVTSLAEGGRQTLISREEFAGKIRSALAARRDQDFLVIARTEALIAGLGHDQALGRARTYADAGAT